MSGIKERVLLYGGSGLVGSRICQLGLDDFEIVAPKHGEVDIQDKRQVRENVLQVSPDRIVYSAGLTRVDLAEEDPEKAFGLNTRGIEWVCESAARLNIPVCYISTDAVFDGTQSGRPYQEDDLPNPVSVYGKSKLEGELITCSFSDKNLVARIILVYTAKFSNKMDLPRLVVASLQRGEKFGGIVDQIVNPIYVDDVVRGLEVLLKRDSKGIYHLGASDYVSNYRFAQMIAEEFGLDRNLIYPVTFGEFFLGKKARRGQFCWLNVEKVEREFGKGILHSTGESLSVFRESF